jgi:hypothetical protein
LKYRAKNVFPVHILFASRGSLWAEPGGEKSLDPRVLGSHLARGFTVVFWQSGRIHGEFFSRFQS